MPFLFLYEEMAQEDEKCNEKKVMKKAKSQRKAPIEVVLF